MPCDDVCELPNLLFGPFTTHDFPVPVLILEALQHDCQVMEGPRYSPSILTSVDCHRDVCESLVHEVATV